MRGEWRKSPLNSGDALQRVLDALVEDAVRLLDEPFPRAEAPGAETAFEDEGELVEAPEMVTFVLHAPGYSSSELLVTVAQSELRVESPDFRLRRQLPPDADGSELGWSYTNGVLSVRIGKLE